MADFEEIMLDYQNAELVNDVRTNPVVSSFIKLIKKVPYFGELVYDSADIKFREFQESKRKELYEYITDSPELITEDKVNNITVLMELARALDVVNKLASNEKVLFISKLFKACCLECDNVNIADYEEYLERIADLSYREIDVLVMLKQNEGTNDKFFEAVTEKYSLKREDVIAILHGLTRSGFCSELTGSFLGYSGGWFSTTSYFDRFLKMIHIIE